MLQKHQHDCDNEMPSAWSLAGCRMGGGISLLSCQLTGVLGSGVNFYRGLGRTLIQCDLVLGVSVPGPTDIVIVSKSTAGSAVTSSKHFLLNS